MPGVQTWKSAHCSPSHRDTHPSTALDEPWWLWNGLQEGRVGKAMDIQQFPKLFSTNTLPFKGFSFMFLKEVSYAYQSCIYLILILCFTFYTKHKQAHLISDFITPVFCEHAVFYRVQSCPDGHWVAIVMRALTWITTLQIWTQWCGMPSSWKRTNLN